MHENKLWEERINNENPHPTSESMQTLPAPPIPKVRELGEE